MEKLRFNSDIYHIQPINKRRIIVSKDVEKPSIYRIIRSDYAATLTAIMIVVIWGMYIALNYFGYLPGTRGRDPLTEADAPFFRNLGFVVTLIGMPIIGWRIRFFRKMFEFGEEVPGEVVNIWFRGDRGKIEYTYRYQNENYHSKKFIFKSERTKHHIQGDKVTLMVNPENPKQNVIKDFYL